jgi:tetratricopeptide (TPR) repeat protein
MRQAWLGAILWPRGSIILGMAGGPLGALAAVLGLAVWSSYVARRANEWRKAASDLKDGLKLTPVAADLKRARRLSPLEAQESRDWYNKGRELQDGGKTAKALRCYDKALEISPDDSDCWYNRASCQCLLNRRAEAVESYRRATELSPTDADALFRLGELADEVGMEGVAHEAYSRFLSHSAGSDGCNTQVRSRLQKLAELQTRRLPEAQAPPGGMRDTSMKSPLSSSEFDSPPESFRSVPVRHSSQASIRPRW